MRLHLVNDEKIINRTIACFEAVFPGENLFVVTNRTGAFRWVTKGTNVLSRTEFLATWKNYTFSHIFIHLLNARKMDILQRIDLKNVPTYWIVWGLDLYNNLLMPKGFEMTDPQSDYARHKPLTRRISEFFDGISRRRKARRTVHFIAEHIDYIVTDTTENDYDYLLKYYPELHDKVWKDFFYYPIDMVLGDKLINGHVHDRHIMIGNSASTSNNHEYAMRFLAQLDTDGRKIYVPLSYSGRKNYVQSVLKMGKEHFGENFCPLLKFMPLDEYSALQQSVSVALYGNWRQEAIGNILISLYLGAKVFLARRNPVYEWAQRHHLTVFILEDITQEQLDTPLPAADQAANRNILLQLYNKERLSKLIQAL